MKFKNIWCQCGMWVAKEDLSGHVGSPKHTAWKERLNMRSAIDTKSTNL